MKNTALEYLHDYSEKANSFITKYIDLKLTEASKIGYIPQKTLEKFKEMCLRGKKIRGALVFLGYQIAEGKNLKGIIETSIFLEIFHTGILVHDDVMDKAEKRRGLISLNWQFDDNIAICIGDFAFFQAYEILLNSKFPLDLKEKALIYFSQYSQRLAYGQEIDLVNNKIDKVAEKDILNIYRYKTAEYTGVLPLLIGSILAGEKSREKLNVLKRFGLALGWIFQIRDDILGVFGDEKETGKSKTSDLKERKITLLQLYLYKHGTKEQKDWQSKILGKKNISNAELTVMRKALRESGAYDYAVKLMEKYRNEAVYLIPSVTDKKNLQEIFQDLIEFLRERKT